MRGPHFATLASSEIAARFAGIVAGSGLSPQRAPASPATRDDRVAAQSGGRPTRQRVSHGHPRARLTLAFAREAALAIAAVLAYFLVRGFTEGSRAEAVANARRLADLERVLHLSWEAQIQEFIIGRPWLETLGNWVYIWGHWPFIAVIAVWLFRCHRDRYYLVRNAFLVSGAIGLVVFALFPVAPPRLAEMGLEDTVTQHSQSYRVLQPTAMVNQYAAVPSLHFGWNLLIGGAVVFLCRIRILKVLAACLTVSMLFAVVLTANHFVLDVVAGAGVALIGLAVSNQLSALPFLTGGVGVRGLPPNGH